MIAEATIILVGEDATEATDTPPPSTTATAIMSLTDLGELPISRILQYCKVKELATLHMCCKAVLNTLICREYKRRDAILQEIYRGCGRASSSAAVVGLSLSKSARHRVIRHDIAKKFAHRMEELQATHGVMKCDADKKYQEDCCPGCQEFPNLYAFVMDENERNNYEFFIRIASEASDNLTIQESEPLIWFEGFVPLMLTNPIGLYLDSPIHPGSTVSRRETEEGEGDINDLVYAADEVDSADVVIHLNLRDTSVGRSDVDYKMFVGLRVTVVALEHGWNRQEQTCGRTMLTRSCPPITSLPPKLVVTTTDNGDPDEMNDYYDGPHHSGEAWCILYCSRRTESHSPRRFARRSCRYSPGASYYRNGSMKSLFFVQNNHTVSFVVSFDMNFNMNDDSDDGSDDNSLDQAA